MKSKLPSHTYQNLCFSDTIIRLEVSSDYLLGKKSPLILTKKISKRCLEQSIYPLSVLREVFYCAADEVLEAVKEVLERKEVK